MMFDAAHVFQPREVRSYQLMATLLGEAMLYTLGREPANSEAGNQPGNQSIQPSMERIRPPLAASPVGVRSAPAGATNQTIHQAREDFVAELPLPISVPERAKRLRLRKGRWEPALAAVAAVLVIACWIGFRDRRLTPALEPPPQASIVLEQQMRALPAQPVSANSNANSQSQTASLRDDLREDRVRKAAKTHAGPVMDGTTRVRYFSDDVTVRYFSPSSAPQRVKDGNGQVRHFSNDVTVRYFNPQSPVSPSPLPDGKSAQHVTR